MRIYKAVFSAILILLLSLLATGKNAEAGDFWRDDLSGTSGEQPGGWRDESNNDEFNAEIAFSYTTSCAAITRTAEGVQGHVWSPLQNCDVDSYPLVEIKVDQVSPATTWRVGIQGFTPQTSWDLNSLTSETGTFVFNYQDLPGLSGNEDFRVFIQVAGEAGKFIEVDFVRICDDAVIPTDTYTATSTITPSITPSSTQTLDMTSTMTPTATPTWTQAVSTSTYTPTATQDVSTSTHTPTATPTQDVSTSTHTPTATPTQDVSTSTHTPTQTQDLNTRTFTPTVTPTQTQDLNTRTSTPTVTPTQTQDLNTRTSTPTVTSTPTEIVGTPTNTPIVSPVPTNTPRATATDIPPAVFDKNLEFIHLNRKTFTPDGSMDRELVISFRSKLPSGEIKISIFNINGRRRAILEVVGNRPDYRANWNGDNESGQPLPAGIYIYEIKAGDSAYRGAVVLAR